MKLFVGYSKAPEQPQSSARPMCHSHTMTNTGREPATIRIAAYRSSPRYALRHGRNNSVNKCRKINLKNLYAFSSVWFHENSTYHLLNKDVWLRILAMTHSLYISQCFSPPILYHRAALPQHKDVFTVCYVPPWFLPIFAQ